LDQQFGIQDLRRVVPALVIAMDQGSPQYAASWYLLHKEGLNLFPTWDPAAHRTWNDTKLALKDAQLMKVIYTSTVLYNYKAGPWNSAAWFKTIKGAVRDLQATMTCEDRLLKKVWPLICADRRWVDEWDTNMVARQEFIGELHKTHEPQTKGEQVALSRWFSWMRAERNERDEWSTRLLILLFYGIYTGAIRRSWQIFRDLPSVGQLPGVGAVAADAVGGIAASSTSNDRMAAHAEGLASLRQRCDNTICVAMELAGDLELRDLSRMIGEVTNPVCQEHGHFMHSLRGVDQVRSAYIGFATCEWMSTLRTILNTLVDTKVLGTCGYLLSFGEKRFQGLHVNSPIVMSQDSLAQSMFTYALALVTRRALSLQDHHLSYPGRLAQLLCTDEVSVKAAFKTLKEHFKDFIAAGEQGSVATRRLVERSSLNTPLMKIIGKLASMTDVLPSLPMVQYIGDLFDGWGQSKVNEDANKACRERENRDQNNKSVRRVRRWAAPRQVELAKQWGREEVRINSEACAPSRVPDDFFVPSQEHKATEQMPLKDILDKATWPTWQPHTVHARSAELAAMGFLRGLGQWELGDRLWNVSLLPERQVVRRVGSDVTFMVLSVQGDIGALMWPMQLRGKYLEFREIACLKWWFVDDFEKWEVLPTVVVSPLHTFVDKQSSDHRTVCLKLVSEPMPLMQWHSERGFATVKETSMEKLIGQLGIDIAACPFGHSTDVEDATALALVLHYQPALSEAAAIVTMHRRRNLMRAEDVHDLKRLLDDEVLTSCMLTPDFTQAKTFINERVNDHTKAAAKKDRLAPLVATVFKHTAAAKGKAKAKAKAHPAAKGKAKAKAHPAVLPAKAHWKPAILAGDSIVLMEACPGPVTIFVDKFNGRFEIMYDRVRVKSVSWTLRGSALAVQTTLREAWRIHEDHGGEPCPYPEMLAVI
jgi:hypothetical protein